jgi:hypothetical protein
MKTNYQNMTVFGKYITFERQLAIQRLTDIKAVRHGH